MTLMKQTAVLDSVVILVCALVLRSGWIFQRIQPLRG